MSTHLDLEEQEQVAQLKHFWAKHGNRITTLALIVAVAFAGWNGWQYWQRKVALEATVMMDELEVAADAGNLDKTQRVFEDLRSKASRSIQAQHAALRVAEMQNAAGKSTEVKSTLVWVTENAKDEGLRALARLRLSALELEANAPESAIQWLASDIPEAFAGLAADRRGDAQLILGKRQDAIDSYRKAWEALSGDADYRRIVEAKLNTLGINPQTTANP